MAKQLSISNPEPQRLAGPQLLHELVPRGADDDTAAIEFCSENGDISKLTYGELHDHANRLAHRLLEATRQSRTTSEHLIVPIFIQQSTELYVSQLASLKAGGAFCPISLDVPEERLRFILQDVRASILLTTRELRAKLPSFDNVRIIVVDDGELDSGDSSAPKPAVTPQNAAYVMYTSGSTGQPKGVLISHASATQALLAHDRHIPQFSRFLQFASPTFDVSVFEIFFPWFRTRTLISCDRRRLLNDLPAAIEKLQVDAAELTPSVAGNLLRGRRSVPSLKVLLTIGEMLKPGVVEDFGQGTDEPGLLHGMYGPTEATIHCTLHTNFPKDVSCSSIGVPLDTVSAFVIRPPSENGVAGQDVEILSLGEEGELAVGGFQLADGYLNRPEQTNAAFLEHPEFGRLYRTGDRARMLPDGRFECLGRISSGQVKLRGQRIELGEIEYAASKTPGCRSSVAEVISGILVMFGVGDESTCTRESIRETCQKWLPSFMVPGDIIILQDLPYLPSGKLDRKSLHKLYTELQAPIEEQGAQEDDRTRDVIDVLESILGCTVQANSALPPLGLDSLAAIRVASELKRKGYAQLDATAILVARNVLDITFKLDETKSTATVNADRDGERTAQVLEDIKRLPILESVTHGIDDAFRCTPVQSAMLGETYKSPEMYCNWIELQVVADAVKLDSALLKLSDRHQLLRSGFVMLPNSEATFATIVWNQILPDQITHVSTLDFNFRIENDQAMLRPCNIQIMRVENGMRLLLRIHHALYDQWSIDVLRADLAAILSGTEPAPPPGFDVVSKHYARYSSLDDWSESPGFWQDYLGNASFSRLPSLTAKRAAPVLSYTPWRSTTISSSALKAQAQDLHCSAPSIFQAALSIILGFYLGSTDVVFGSVFSGRTIAIPDIDRIFGPCLATLPLRINAASANTCHDLVSAISGLNRNVQKHLLTPPAAIRKAAGVSPGSLMFDVLFVWQQSSIYHEMSDLVKEVDSADRHEFNLVLEVNPSAESVQIRATYRPNVLAAQQVDILLQQMEAIVTDILRAPSSSIKELGKAFSSNLLSITNPQPQSVVPHQDLASLLESTAEQNPEVPAIIFSEDFDRKGQGLSSITYRQLDTRANKVANALVTFGLLPDELVCVCLEKSVDLYVSILATIKAGAGYLPLLPETPQARVASVMSQSPTRICLCDASSAELFKDHPDLQIVDMSKLDLSNFSASRPQALQHPSRVAYAVYTSGSTGEPKGVAVTVKNLHANLEVLSELYDARPNDRLLQACSQAFDVSVFEIFFTFYKGMTLCSAPKETLFRDLEQSINIFGVTHLSLTPTVAALIDPANVPTVKFLVTAGEGLNEKVFNKWAEHGLHQGYGPSETTNICTVKMRVALDDAINSIGPPFRNTSAFVTAPNEDFRILPAGSFGEFVFGGEQVFRGYIGRDELNAEKIIDHPEFGRLYRSGDTGHILYDGSLLISGRLDDQVKIRGNRVELGEINAVLMHHSEVLDCTTVVLGQGSTDQLIASFFVPDSDKKAAKTELVQIDTQIISDLFDSLEASLPGYMVPSLTIPVGQLPRTSQGKLDKRLLHAVWSRLDQEQRSSFSRSHDQNGQDEPFSSNEQVMAQKLAELLDIPLPSLTRHSSFFALGLNSLNAIQLAKALEPFLETRVNVTTILRNPSIARLNSSIVGKEKDSKSKVTKSIRDVFSEQFVKSVEDDFSSQDLLVEAILPCTPLQEVMLSASGFAGTDAYSNTTNLRVSGDLQRLKDAWQCITQRHSILRTVFVETPIGSHPYAQVVLKNARLPWFDYTEDGNSGLLTGDPDTASHRDKVSASAPFCIEVNLVDDHPELILYMHHAIYDGISMSNLFAEIESFYRSEALETTVSFESFLAELASHNDPQSIEFWSSKFKGFLPHPLPRQEGSTPTGERTISQELTHNSRDLKAFCEMNSVTALSVFQSAWVKTLASAQGISDVCFGNVVSGRAGAVPGIERLIAPCFNTLPVRTSLDSLQSNLDLIRDLHYSNVDNLDHQLTALRRIQTLSADPSAHIFDSLMLLQPPAESLDPKIWTVESETGSMDLPLVVEIVPQEARFKVYLHFLTDIIHPALAQDLLDAFIAALSSCLQFTSSSVRSFLNFDSSRIEGKLAPVREEAVPNSNGSTPSSSGDSEWSPIEKEIRHIFASLSGVEASRISKITSLYQIGLDSLNAVQVASKLRQIGFKVDAADVMQQRTPADIGRRISEHTEIEIERTHDIDFQSFDERYRPQVLELTHIGEEAVETVRPCTPAQKGMLAQSLQTEGKLYVNSLVYRVPDELDTDFIQQAWECVQRKHQVLRMGFYQLEDAETPFAMVVYKPDWPSLPKETINSSAEFHDPENVRSQILEKLYLPVWRLNIFETTKQGRTMQLTIHHAVYDADSLQLLLSDLALALRSRDVGAATDIDAVLSSTLRASASRREKSEKFWSQTLESAGYAKFPNLCPTSISRSSIESVQITSSVAPATLEAFCRQNEVTTQGIGQSTWAALLATYTGEPGVTFGTVFSGYASSTSKGVAFPSISTVPVFCDTTKAAIDVVKAMVSFNASAQKYRSTPLTDIQRYAGRAGQTLFDTVFVYQKSSLPHEDRFDWELVSETAAVDYTVSLELGNAIHDRFDLRLTFDTKILPAAHASLMLEQYDRLLQKLVNSDLDSDRLFDGVLSLLPAKHDELPCPVKLLHEFVEMGAEMYAEKPALEFITSFETGRKGRKIWTYKELNEQSNQIAHMLQKHGVQPGGVVALCMPKCAEASLAFVGILKAGCAFLAMDPELPVARKQFILEDSQSQLLLVDSESEWKIESDVRIVACRADAFADLPITPVKISRVDPSATSYCLYTSGTTGTPKGCELTHENAVQAMMSFQRLFKGHWTGSSRWLQFASYWFDVSVLEQFWSWSIGITVIGAPRDLVLEDLAEFLRAAHITHIDLTPSLARLITPADVPSLCKGVFITGGEALKQEIINAWGPEKVICNGYGPTEATIGVTMNRFVGTDAKPSNIGTQFDNVGSLVLAPGTDTPVLRGGVGELCVSGKLVGKGYLNRPDQTTKAFPFLKRFGKKVYRTGDLVRMLADGSFSFLGRQDTQAKLRGQRLEIDEIDAVIKTSEAEISEVASLVVKANDGNREMLVSFITQHEFNRSKPSIETSTESLRLVQTADQACRDRLPGYMVPTHIIPISNIPLTVNNKVDSKRLINLFQSLANQDLQGLKGNHPGGRELSAIETKVVKALNKLLEISTKDIRPDSNIFSLGLSSISAINFTTVLKRSGFRYASVANVMKNPTVERLAKSISGEDHGSEVEQNSIQQAQLSLSAFGQRFRNFASTALARDISKVEAVAPCTPLQEGLLIESMKSSSRPYFNQFLYRLEQVDFSRVEKAIFQIVTDIQILRTVFLRTDDGFAQVVLGDPGIRLHQHSVKDQDFDDFVAEQKRTWQEGVDQDTLSPLEVFIVQTPSKATLVFHAHHAIYDGISWDLMMNALENAYICGSSGNTGPKFIEALPYGPLCPHPGSQSFWLGRLQNVSFVPLPVLNQEPDSEMSMASASLKFSDADENLRRKAGVSHQAIFEAAFVAALNQHFSESQTYGLVVSGRSIGLEDASRVIGPMFNTIPCAVDIRLSDTWDDIVQRCHGANIASMPFQHSPLRDVRKSCGRKPTDAMFDILFVFQRRDEPTEDRTFREVESAVEPDYPLAFDVELLGTDEVNVIAAAQSAFASPQMVQELVDSFTQALNWILTEVDTKVGDHFKIYESSHAQAHQYQTNGVHKMDLSTEEKWTTQALTVRDAIAQLAGCEKEDISQQTTIFSLGLDSIDAVKLGSRLKKSGLAIPVSRILQTQTISKMLGAVQTSSDSEDEQSSAGYLGELEKQLSPMHQQLLLKEGIDVDRVIPASPGQEALVAEMLRSDFLQYFNHDILRLSPDTDLEKLKLAWQLVIDATPILRTSFVEIADSQIDAVFAQIVHHPSPVRFDNISAQSMVDLQTRLDEIRKHVLASFNHHPPLRLTIATIQSEHYFILSLSHAQYDGQSLGLIHEDVARAYHNQYEPRPSYDLTLDESLRAVVPDALKFWRGSLAGCRASRVMTSRAVSSDDQVHRAERTCSISSQRARTHCQKLGISMQSLAQTAWAILLAHYSQSLEVIFGVVLACRDSEEAETVLFPTMNTVPLKASLHGSGLQMLEYIQSTMNDVRPYQRTPLRAVQRACSNVLDRTGVSDGTGLFDTLFIYQARSESTGDHSTPLYDSVEGSSNIEYPIAVELEAVRDELLVRAACKGHVMDRDGTDKLLQEYDRVLHSLLDTPEEAIVAFRGNEVSIYGMPSFHLQRTNPTQQATDVIGTTGFDEAEEAAVSPIAKTIKSALSQVSGTPAEEISMNSTIESIGIDSISAIKVSALLRKQSVKLSVGAMMKASTLVNMLDLTDGHATTDENEEYSSEDVLNTILKDVKTDHLLTEVGLQGADVENILPVAAGQAYMISMWQKTEGQIFMPTFQYLLKKQSSVDDVRSAWKKTIAKHSALRTVFSKTRSSLVPLVQIILKELSTNFFVQENEDLEDVLVQPLAGLYMQKTQQGQQLNLRIHHALYDAVSLPMILQDFETFLTQREPKEPNVNFKDFLALSLNPTHQTVRKQFWTGHLNNTHPASLPQPQTKGPQQRLDIFKPTLTSSARRLESLARKSGLALQSILFAVYAQVYLNLTTDSSPAPGQDVVLGIYLSNRSHLPDLDRLAAPTLNLLPLVVREPRGRALLELAAEIQTDLRAIGKRENFGAALGEIEQWTGVRVDTFVNFLRLPEVEEGRDGEGWIEEVVGESKMERSRVVDAGTGGFELPKGLRGFEVGDAYQHAVDVELIVADGVLSLGCFGPVEMVGLGRAEEAIAEFKTLLDELVEEE